MPKQSTPFVVTVHRTKGQYDVTLTQEGVNEFTVTYGKHVRAGLHYNRAAAEFGECVMHAAACAGRVLDEES